MPQEITLQNELLTVRISPLGAELQSIRLRREADREIIWHGDPAFWGGRSPILFPAVGRAWDDTVRIDGVPHTLPKHGFMRAKVFAVENATATSATFVYADEGLDREAFPWPYRLAVVFTLAEARLNVQISATNLGATTMYFQVGGHPGFLLPDFAEGAEVDGYVALSGSPKSVVRAGRGGCAEPGEFAFPTTAEGLVPLCVDTFANEALIFENHQVDAVTVLDTSKRPIAKVRSSAPVWLLWSPQGVHAPFVCVEPWYGLCDRVFFDGPIEQRPYVNSAAPGETWEGGYEIEVC